MLTELALPNIDEEQQKPFFYDRIGECLQPCDKDGVQHSIKLVNTRLWLYGLEEKYGKHISIDEVPDSEWDVLTGQCDSVWFMGIYAPSDFSRQHAQKYDYQYLYALPDLDTETDVVASPFAIPEYVPNPFIADGWETWDLAVKHLHHRGKKVLIDFVPNHTAVDSRLVYEHPEYFIQGLKEQYEQNPFLFIPIVADDGNTYYIAHGKEAESGEWADTLQLNYARADVQQEMERQLLELVDRADGVRCDMAMLVNPSTFLHTWGWLLKEDERIFMSQNDFWTHTIPVVKDKAKRLGKDFMFLGEAYWEKEQLGKSFDFLYQQDLYHSLISAVRDRSIQNFRNNIGNVLRSTGRCMDCVYTENHDEKRVAGVMEIEASKAAFASIAFLPRTLLLVNQGQEYGCEIKPPMQIRRFPNEKSDSDLERFYSDVFFFKNSQLFSQGQWNIADVHTYSQNLIALHVTSPDRKISGVVCVNLGNETADCSVPCVQHGEKAAVYSLNQGLWIQPDEQRVDGLFLRLSPFESQIILYESKVQQEVRLQWN